MGVAIRGCRCFLWAQLLGLCFLAGVAMATSPSFLRSSSTSPLVCFPLISSLLSWSLSLTSSDLTLGTSLSVPTTLISSVPSLSSSLRRQPLPRSENGQRLGSLFRLPGAQGATAAPAQPVLGAAAVGKALRRRLLPSLSGEPCGQIPPAPFSGGSDLGEVLPQAFALGWLCGAEAHELAGLMKPTWAVCCQGPCRPFGVDPCESLDTRP